MYEHTWVVYSCINNYQSHPNSLNRCSPLLKRRFLTQAGKTSSRVNFWRVAWYKGCTLCLCQASTFLSLSLLIMKFLVRAGEMDVVHICCPILSFINKGNLLYRWIGLNHSRFKASSQFESVPWPFQPLCERKQKVLTIFANNILLENLNKNVWWWHSFHTTPARYAKMTRGFLLRSSPLVLPLPTLVCWSPTRLLTISRWGQRANTPTSQRYRPEKKNN